MPVELAHRNYVIYSSYGNEPLTLQNMNLSDQRVGDLFRLPLKYEILY
jgi:hypothetical protein